MVQGTNNGNECEIIKTHIQPNFTDGLCVRGGRDEEEIKNQTWILDS